MIYLLIAISFFHLIPQLPRYPLITDIGSRFVLCACKLYSQILHKLLFEGQYHNTVLVCYTTNTTAYFQTGFGILSAVKTKRQLVHFLLYINRWSTLLGTCLGLIYFKVSPLVSYSVHSFVLSYSAQYIYIVCAVAGVCCYSNSRLFFVLKKIQPLVKSNSYGQDADIKTIPCN